MHVQYKAYTINTFDLFINFLESRYSPMQLVSMLCKNIFNCQQVKTKQQSSPGKTHDQID